MKKDKEQIRLNTMQKIDSLHKKLNSKNTFDSENVSEFDDCDMSDL